MCTARSQNARASLAHSNARLHARVLANACTLHSPRMRALRSRIATHGSTLVGQRSREQISAPRMRLLRSRIATHGSKLTSRNAASNALIRTDLSISTPPPATLTPIRTDQRRADRCGRPSTEPGRAENPQIQTSLPQAKTTPSNGGPARSDARRSVPQRSSSSPASWPARKAFAKAAQRLKQNSDLKGPAGQQRSCIEGSASAQSICKSRAALKNAF